MHTQRERERTSVQRKESQIESQALQPLFGLGTPLPTFACNLQWLTSCQAPAPAGTESSPSCSASTTWLERRSHKEGVPGAWHVLPSFSVFLGWGILSRGDQGSPLPALPTHSLTLLHTCSSSRSRSVLLGIPMAGVGGVLHASEHWLAEHSLGRRGGKGRSWLATGKEREQRLGWARQSSPGIAGMQPSSSSSLHVMKSKRGGFGSAINSCIQAGEGRQALQGTASPSMQHTQ